jgi:GNAT superfamily N-acetyltransferase
MGIKLSRQPQLSTQTLVAVQAETILQSFTPKRMRTKKGDMNVHHIYNPQTLLPKHKEAIFNLLYPVGLSAFGRINSKEAADDIRAHLFSSSNLVAVTDPTNDNQVVAFQVWDILELNPNRAQRRETVLYLAGICVHRTYQAAGVGTALLTLLLAKKKTRYIAMFTQNPILKRAVDRILGVQTYPNATSTPEHIRLIAERLAIHLNLKTFHTETLIHVGRYGSPSSIDQQSSTISDTVYRQLFSRLRRNEGDAFLCIGI